MLGRNITATVANLRTVDWQSLGINFVLVYSPGSLPRRAAHPDRDAHLSGRRDASSDEIALLKTAAVDVPERHGGARPGSDRSGRQVLLDLTLAIRGASAITLIAAVLVLGGALAAGHRHRVYEAVVLKMLGATRLRLIAAYALEYLLLGLATALFGVAAGSLAAWLVVSEMMNLRIRVATAAGARRRRSARLR